MEDSVNIGLICDEVVPKIPEGHTHLLIMVRSKNYAILYRLSDGMYMGEIADKMALFGENPNKRESRLFCSHQFGLKFVKSLAYPEGYFTLKANAEHLECPLIFEYDYDSAHTILIPGDNFNLAVNGGPVAKTRKIGGKFN